MNLRRTLTGLAVAAGVVALAACGGSSSEPADGKSAPVRIGVADASENYWSVYQARAKDEGIDVELVNFTDYNQPNPALSQKQLDLNEFQHLQYLAEYNTNADDTLVPIGATAVYPLPLYSVEHDSIESLPDGATVAIPNDPTNQARALLVLQAAGLVALENGGSTASTPADLEPSSKVTVKAVDASQTATNIKSVDAAVVNNNFATAAQLSADDIIYKDDVNAEEFKPYINVFVARKADEDNTTFRTLAELYHDPAVLKAAREDLGDDGVFKENSVEDLQSTLSSIEDSVRSAKQ